MTKGSPRHDTGTSSCICNEDADDLLRDMLGGVTFDVEWVEEDDKDDAQRLVPGKVPKQPTKRIHLSTQSHGTMFVKDYVLDVDSSSSIFEYSYRCCIDGRVERPSLQVVDLGPNRGNGMIVTSPIPCGSVIYTERAAAATQVPPIKIQACQYCFRSLESISGLSNHLPCQELWPVPALQFPIDEDQTTTVVQVDSFGRIRCASCRSLFCTQHHFDHFTEEYGSCCKMTDILEAVEKMEGEGGAVQAPVALAARLFTHCIQYYRTNQESIEGHFLEGICGEAKDLDSLELGVQDSKGQYSLEHLYSRISTILNLTYFERDTFSLEHFHKIAAKAGRNGFGLLTQSPFKSYYAGLLRKSISRDSSEHQSNMRQVAQALVGSDGLQRGMDRDIEAKVAPEICAVFPLTARCNHSCEPNAQVRSQEFVDNHIDVVALRDLDAGEELLISYIPVGTGVGKRSTIHRRRELQAKYLFHCNCPKCRL